MSIVIYFHLCIKFYWKYDYLTKTNDAQHELSSELLTFLRRNIGPK